MHRRSEVRKKRLVRTIDTSPFDRVSQSRTIVRNSRRSRVAGEVCDRRGDRQRQQLQLHPVSVLPVRGGDEDQR
jgi:hypothetical protein